MLYSELNDTSNVPVAIYDGVGEGEGVGVGVPGHGINPFGL